MKVRPTRWLMLLVALSALCVVLIAQPDDHTTSAAHADVRHALTLQPTPTLPQVATHHAPSSTAFTPTGTATRHHPTSLPATSIEVARPPEVTSSSPVSTTTSTSIPMTPAAPSIQATVTAPSTFTGWLEGPTSVSASYPVNASSALHAAATWTGATSLTLTATCGVAATTTSGASGLSVALSPGECTVTLAGPADVPTTSFQISVGAS